MSASSSIKRNSPLIWAIAFFDVEVPCYFLKSTTWIFFSVINKMTFQANELVMYFSLKNQDLKVILAGSNSLAGPPMQIFQLPLLATASGQVHNGFYRHSWWTLLVGWCPSNVCPVWHLWWLTPPSQMLCQSIPILLSHQRATQTLCHFVSRKVGFCISYFVFYHLS